MRQPLRGSCLSGFRKTSGRPSAKWDREADVVILGYGGAGASAAITAKDAGADVVIFEKTAQGGGNTAVSSGGMMIPNNRERAITYLGKDLRLC